MSLRVGALCAGYGGLELGLQLAGIDTDLVWVSETDKHASAVLDARFGVPNLGDLTEIADPPQVDAITAGFPCQPVSQAGKRAGIDDERWLIRDVVSVARRAGAQWIFLENVRGVLTANQGDAFGQVLDALAEGGFDAKWACIRADQSVGACHRRDRWFCIATSRDTDTSRSGLLRTPESKDDDTDQRRGRRHDSDNLGEGRGSRAAADADGAGSEAWGDARRASQLEAGVEPVGSAAPAAHASGVGRCAGSRLGEGQPSQQRGDGSGDDGDTTAAYTTGTERRGEEHETVVAPAGSAPKPGERHSSYAWGDYADAINRWEWAIGRAAPKPVTDGKLSSRFVEWMMGLPDGWVTGVGLSRTQELKILGNGVVPQQAAAAYGWLLEQ